MLYTMDNIKVGESCIIEKVDGKDDIKHRLLDIGLVNGLNVECALVSPFGDPKAYWIKGALIALRNDDAKNILVKR